MPEMRNNLQQQLEKLEKVRHIGMSQKNLGKFVSILGGELSLLLVKKK